MSQNESRPKAENPDEPLFSGTDSSLDFTIRTPAPPPAPDASPVVARPRKKTPSRAPRKTSAFPGVTASVLAVIAIAAVVAFAMTRRSSEAPVTPPPAAGRAAPGGRIPDTPESSPAQAPPAATAEPQPGQKRAWPTNFLKAFEEYAGKPGSKAMAVALDSDGKMAYIGAFRPTQSEANEAALSLCTGLKTQAGVREDCRLYAVGDEVVWK